MNIIEELWYGNISPCERDFKRGGTYSELLGYIVRHEEDLQKRRNDEEKEIFEKFSIDPVLSSVIKLHNQNFSCFKKKCLTISNYTGTIYTET